MQTNKIYEGNCLEVLKTFPDKSINCVITSPPYWQLRDYGWTGQWGLEPTFKMYLENLWSLMDEIFRVLTDDGTVWVNLGDTYSTISGGSKQLYKGDKTQYGAISHDNKFADQNKLGLVSKCLLLIPHRFAIGCIERGWIMRNDIIWAKRNGMPESVTDRFSKKHEYFFFMVKSEKYYFDLESIKDRTLTYDNSNRDRDATKLNNTPGRTRMAGLKENNYITRNPGTVSDFWDIPLSAGNSGHFATYNTRLIDKPIIAGCPKGGVILDPFCGTATTGCRAIDLDRQFIGIEGNPDYVAIGNKNLYPFQVTQKLF